MTPLDLTKTWDAVIYGDGGAIPNPGFAGYGIHGYFFVSVNDEQFVTPKKPVILKNHFMDFFNPEGVAGDYSTPTTEGYIACLNTGVFKQKSTGTLVSPEFYVDRCYSFFEETSNNFAELSAALEIFKVGLSVGEGRLKNLTLVLDSKYVLDTLQTYGDAYRRNGWKKSDGNPPKNPELIAMILDKRDELLKQGCRINYLWCKGHNGNLGNGMADYQASVAVRRSKKLDNVTDVIWSPIKKYWDAETERHPFMQFKRAYFNRVREHNKPGQYYLIEPATEELMIGKRDHEGYAVINLKEPCAYMEAMIDAQGNFGQDENRVILGRLDRLYSKMVQKYVRWHGSYCFEKSSNGRSLNFLDVTPVAVEHNPPALIYRVTEAFSKLEEKLLEFIKITGEASSEVGEPLDIFGLVIHEISDVFFTQEEKKVGKEIVFKTVLKPEFVVGYKNHVLDIIEVVDGKDYELKVPLALGVDLPARNHLKQLEDHKPKIYLITWRTSPQTLQYACVVDCVSGTGIWSNYFCDRIFLKPK